MMLQNLTRTFRKKALWQEERRMSGFPFIPMSVTRWLTEKGTSIQEIRLFLTDGLIFSHHFPPGRKP